MSMVLEADDITTYSGIPSFSVKPVSFCVQFAPISGGLFLYSSPPPIVFHRYTVYDCQIKWIPCFSLS